MIVYVRADSAPVKQISADCDKKMREGFSGGRFAVRVDPVRVAFFEARMSTGDYRIPPLG